MLGTGIKAPNFTLPDKNGKAVALSDFAGKKVVLYFYSKDNTSGCTRRALAFADAYAECWGLLRRFCCTYQGSSTLRRSL
jgi:thioredoxin-dependent peroxiredoxin